MIKNIHLIAILCLVLSGCINDINAETPNSSPNTPPLLQEVHFRELDTGIYGGNISFTSKQIKIIENQSDYNLELVKYGNQQPETLDFSTGQVLLIDMGMRGSGGHAINVSSIEVSANYIKVNVVSTIPGKGCIVTQALTNPYQFVFIPTKKEILIEEHLNQKDCTQ